MLSQPSDAARATEAWDRFSAAWPFDPVPYRRAAARAEFERLTEAEREEAIRCACSFAKAWRVGGRRGSPDARAWIVAKGWKAFEPTPSSAPPAPRASAQSGARLMAARLPDGSYRLHPDSPQLRQWKEYERRTLGRSRLGTLRRAEWPPDTVSAADASAASCAPPHAGDSARRPTG